MTLRHTPHHPAAPGASSLPGRHHAATGQEEVVRHHHDEIRDRGVLDAIGRAIASPVMDSARGTDPYLPEASADDHAPLVKPAR